MNQTRMDQIVYQPQNDQDKKDNLFMLTSEQTRLLNALMPVGSKMQGVPAKKKDTALVFQHERNTKTFYDNPKQQSMYIPPEPISLAAQLSPEMQKCMRIIKRLKNHPQSGVFLDPVDTTVITDYLDYVSEPMDLGTIQYNILNGVYETFTQFLVDVKKVWYNAYSYNPKGTQIYLMTIEMDKFFDNILQQQNVPIPASYVSLPPPPVREIPQPVPRPEPTKKKPAPTVFVSDVPLTMQEKRNLGSLIKKLPHEYLKGVWEIVSSATNDNTEELEFDIETLPARKARELQQYVKRSFATIDAKNKQLTSFETRAKENQASENESSFIIDSDDSD